MTTHSKSTIRAVVFDLGKVLVDFDYGIAARKIAARAKMPVNELGVFILSAPVLLRYETGQLTTQQFYDAIRDGTGFSGSLEEFGATFADIFWPISSMVKLHSAVRQQNIPTYIFSNTNELAVGHIRRNFPFFSNFDGYILSYEHGAMKPDGKLYEVVERQSGQRGDEILYLDDRPENVEAGAARGWQVILQESPEKTHASLKALGLLQ